MKVKGNTIYTTLPGLIVCLGLMLLGIYVADLLGLLLVKLEILPSGNTSPISGIFISILFGIMIRNTIGLHTIFKPGVLFSLKYVLRIGIVFLGIRLSIVDALKLGIWGLPLIIICIASGLLITLYFTKKMGQSERLGTLIATGTGICGITAIMAVSPVIKARENEISYAVANITIFGLVGMLFYPFLANLFFGTDPVKTGLFLGTAIHDTAQVTGAALIFAQMYDLEQVIDVATVTKLTRNLFMIAVIPIVSYFFYKNIDRNTKSQALPKWYKLVPGFIVGFLLLALLRTIGDITVTNSSVAFGFIEIETWEMFHDSLSNIGSTYLLGLAMAGVGLSTDFKMFKGLGFKPFYIGLIAAIAIGIVSVTLISSFGHFIDLTM